MKYEKNKISLRQLMLLFIMMTFSPAIRLFPGVSVKVAEQSGWLSPIPSFLVLLILVFIMDAFFKKNQDMGLAEIIEKILGKILGKVLLIVYYIWIFILLGLYIRFYSERITESIFPDTSIQFFIVVLLLFLFYGILHGGLEIFARYNELLVAIFVLFFGIISVLALSNFEISRLFPITPKDTVPIVGGSYGILAIWGYYFFMFFLAEKVNDKGKIKTQGIKAGIFQTIMAIVIIGSAIGILGSSLVKHVPLPFFTIAKIISVLGILERLESVVLSLWVIADLVIVVVFGFFIESLSKSLFKLKDTRILATPIVLLAYVLAFFITKNRFELSAFSVSLALYINIVLEIVVPVLLFTIGKIRKVI